MGRLSDVLHGGEVTADAVARVRDVVEFEPPDLKRKLIRFWILLVLATGIATYGLIGDSVATVIGAMIVARSCSRSWDSPTALASETAGRSGCPCWSEQAGS